MARKDYSKFSKQTEAKKTEQIETALEDYEYESEKHGMVSDCTRLNVRAEPSTNAEILCEIDFKTEIIIDEKNSTDEFYKVCTASGVEGYCMKKYITILP